MHEAESPKLARLIEFAEVLSRLNDFQEILRLVAKKALSFIPAETALILMVNPQTRDTCKTFIREGREEDNRKYQSVQNQITGWIMRADRALLSADIKTDLRFPKVNWGSLAVKSVIGAPLRTESAIIGTLVLLNQTRGDAFSEDDLHDLEKIAVVAAPCLRNVQKIAAYFNSPVPEVVLLGKYAQAGLLGKSPKFVELLQAIEAAARCEVRVLLEGQTGTGKELVARAIHRFNTRSRHPFVAIDCGAIPSNLIESELFGHVKGAFTGATQDRKGLLAEANHGTLFLDEIANLPLDIQAKFMRVLEQNEVRPLGGNKTFPLDVRLISASSQPLQKLVEKGGFREDLYYRLHVYPIYIPALNERHVDIPLLAHHFLKTFARQQQKPVESFHAELLDYMKQRHWEGNVRQLENFVERLVTLAPPETKILDYAILSADLKKELRKARLVPEESPAALSLNERVNEYEAQLIRQALVANGGNQSQTAKQLKIPVQTLSYKIAKLGITKS